MEISNGTGDIVCKIVTHVCLSLPLVWVWQINIGINKVFTCTFPPEQITQGEGADQEKDGSSQNIFDQSDCISSHRCKQQLLSRPQPQTLSKCNVSCASSTVVQKLAAGRQ